MKTTDLTWEQRMYEWEKTSYELVDVPGEHLPATELERVKTVYGIEDKFQLTAPLVTRHNLAGAWYGHRADGFWNERINE